MSVTEILYAIMKKRNFSQRYLAEKLGYTTASGVSTKLSRANGMRIDTLLRFLDAMDCEIVIKSKSDSEKWTVSWSDDREERS